jgi:pyrroloquinoline quinone (PQQ) biosynthesis protein C
MARSWKELTSTQLILPSARSRSATFFACVHMSMWIARNAMVGHEVAELVAGELLMTVGCEAGAQIQGWE